MFPYTPRSPPGTGKGTYHLDHNLDHPTGLWCPHWIPRLTHRLLMLQGLRRVVVILPHDLPHMGRRDGPRWTSRGRSGRPARKAKGGCGMELPLRAGDCP